MNPSSRGGGSLENAGGGGQPAKKNFPVPSFFFRHVDMKAPPTLPSGPYTGPLVKPSMPSADTQTRSGPQLNGASAPLKKADQTSITCALPRSVRRGE